MYDDILVPTDGSDGTALAVEHATALASAFDSTVHVLSVVDSRTLRESVGRYRRRGVAGGRARTSGRRGRVRHGVDSRRDRDRDGRP